MTNQLSFDPNESNQEPVGDDDTSVIPQPAERSSSPDAPSSVMEVGGSDLESAIGSDESLRTPAGSDHEDNAVGSMNIEPVENRKDLPRSNDSEARLDSNDGFRWKDDDIVIVKRSEQVDDPQSENTTVAAAREPRGAASLPSVNGVLTNRWNLIEFLSRRLIVPSDSISKYYDDLLRYVPGRVPIVSAPASDELVSAVSGDDEVVFPVFLELKPRWEPGTTTAVPFDDVISIHFRTDRDLEEHKARKFSNVGISPPLVVTPQIFAGGAQTLADIGEGQPRTRKRQTVALQRASAWSGALIVGLAAVVSDANVESASALARLLDGRPWGRLKAASHLRALTPMRSGRPPRPGRDLESCLFSHIIERFAADGLPGDPVEFVRSLPDQVDIDERSARALGKICAILDGEVEFKPFRRTGSPVAKGLLVALLRRNPERLQPWATDVARADPVSALTAGALLGVAAGRHTLPNHMRTPELDLALANVELAAMTSTSEPGRSDVETRQIDPNGLVKHRIRLDGFPDINLSEQPPSALNDLLAEATFSPEIEKQCIRLAIEEDWLEVLSIRSDRFAIALATGNAKGSAAKALRVLLEQS